VGGIPRDSVTIEARAQGREWRAAGCPRGAVSSTNCSDVTSCASRSPTPSPPGCCCSSRRSCFRRSAPRTGCVRSSSRCRAAAPIVADLLQRLRERKLVQWSLAYIAAAFALIQVLDVVAQRFGWSESIERLLIVALAIGFFVVLVLAWY